MAGAAVLAGLSLPADAPPAFLLDANRNPSGPPPQPGRFDNRWVVFAQDLPSARRLMEAGVRRLIVAATGVQVDLAHVLGRYKEAGMELLRVDTGGRLELLDPPKPRSFRSLGYRALVRLGLRRNPAGGFGARVPQPSSGSGYG